MTLIRGVCEISVLQVSLTCEARNHGVGLWWSTVCLVFFLCNSPPILNLGAVSLYRPAKKGTTKAN